MCAFVCAAWQQNHASLVSRRIARPSCDWHARRCWWSLQQLGSFCTVLQLNLVLLQKQFHQITVSADNNNNSKASFEA